MVSFNRNNWIKYPVTFGSSAAIADLVAVAPFWCLAASQQPSGAGTYYETLSERVLTTFSNEIRSTFQNQNYMATWGLQVTWENIVADVMPVNASVVCKY